MIDVGQGRRPTPSGSSSAARRAQRRQAQLLQVRLRQGRGDRRHAEHLRAATRPIRQPGVPDNAHLSMLRHVIEKKNPAVGILSIREAMRANARIQQLERLALELLAAGKWTPYEQGQRPGIENTDAVSIMRVAEASG